MNKVIIQSPEGEKIEIYSEGEFWLVGHVESIDMCFYPPKQLHHPTSNQRGKERN